MSWRAPTNRLFFRFVRPALRPRRSSLAAAVITLLAMSFGLALALLLLAAMERLARDSARTWVIERDPISVLIFVIGVCLILTLGLFLRAWHRRGLLSLLGPLDGRFWATLLLGALVAAISIAASIAMLIIAAEQGWIAPLEEDWPSAFPPAGEIARGLLWGLAVIAPAAVAEELYFRGYLQQQLAARRASPWAWAVAPSFAFAALHYDPTLPAADQWPYLIDTFSFGLITAYATWRTGGLGLAIGAHVSNNWIAWLFVAFEAGVDDASDAFLSVEPMGPSQLIFIATFALLTVAALEAGPLRRRLGLPPLRGGRVS